MTAAVAPVDPIEDRAKNATAIEVQAKMAVAVEVGIAIRGENRRGSTAIRPLGH